MKVGIDRSSGIEAISSAALMASAADRNDVTVVTADGGVTGDRAWSIFVENLSAISM
jgi:hypothetical protein